MTIQIYVLFISHCFFTGKFDLRDTHRWGTVWDDDLQFKGDNSTTETTDNLWEHTGRPISSPQWTQV